ncbi:MAG: glycosyltransferase [Candidatus Kariarchaeaceae archaeon]|jgi:GT2 family glycosyltransferase
MVTYHRPNDFTNCVESILKNTIVKYHLHIIDNSQGAIDEQLNKYKNLANISVHRNDVNIGKPKSVNDCFFKISSNFNRFFVSMDSDIVVKKGWLLNLSRSFDFVSRSTKVGIIAPVIQNNNEETWQWQLTNGVRMHNISKLGDDSHCRGVFENRYTSGPVLVINRTLFDNVGGFDTKQLYGADDGILCRKSHNRGFFVGIDTNVTVMHVNNDSDKEYESWKVRNIKGNVDEKGRWDNL